MDPILFGQSTKRKGTKLMFWTDINQASERLVGSIVNWNGEPVYIESVFANTKGQPVASCITEDDTKIIELSDEGWNNFRDLPVLGWFNLVSERKNTVSPIYLERRAVRARIHGLSYNNTKIYRASDQGIENIRDTDLRYYFRNPGYKETMKDVSNYPKVSTILMALSSTPSGVSFSRNFCVIVTEEGMKWLYRKTNRIGFFTGTDSLNLFPRHGFYKEELQACPSFDITKIQEF